MTHEAKSRQSRIWRVKSSFFFSPQGRVLPTVPRDRFLAHFFGFNFDISLTVVHQTLTRPFPHLPGREGQSLEASCIRMEAEVPVVAGFVLFVC